MLSFNSPFSLTDSRVSCLLSLSLSCSCAGLVDVSLMVLFDSPVMRIIFCPSITEKRLFSSYAVFCLSFSLQLLPCLSFVCIRVPPSSLFYVHPVVVLCVSLSVSVSRFVSELYLITQFHSDVSICPLHLLCLSLSLSLLFWPLLWFSFVLSTSSVV